MKTEETIYSFDTKQKTKWSLHLQDLKDYMRQAGEVTYADAHKQHRNEGWEYFLLKYPKIKQKSNFHNISVTLLTKNIWFILFLVFSFYELLRNTVQWLW